MAEGDKRRAVTTRIIWIVIGVFFLIMVVSQIMILFGTGFRTEVATLYQATESIGFKGVFVRDEKLVSYNVNGIIRYTHKDGSKVGKGAVIAQIYKSRNDIALQQRIDDLVSQRDVLADVQSLVGADTSQLDSFSTQITEKHAKLLEYIYEGDYESASSLKSDILNLQSKREIVKGTETSYAEKIARIDGEIASLRAEVTSEPYDIYITETGYFVSTVDGYEDKLSTANVFDLTAEDIDRITSSDISQSERKGVIGKLVGDYKWYMVGVLDTVRLGTVFEGASVSMRVGSSGQQVRADIVSLKKLGDGRSLAVFRFDMFLDEHIASRVEQVRLLLDDYNGIMIPNSALRVSDEDGSVGVYVQDGIIARFKKVRQILSQEDYTLVADTSGQEGYLALYDNIIVEGRDLHEGKIIR
ncbi:MAG: hypothetical protein IJT87_06045 [Ruminiclostridium sp.]|nr:hypothetical protein [Ruminiclostridium sp.]